MIVSAEQFSAGGIQKYPASEWTPVGVVVIPAEHGVLKDGTGTVNQCGIMSLVSMSYSTPEVGSQNDERLYWGGHPINISGKSDGLGRYDSVTNGLQNYDQGIKIATQTEVGGIPYGGVINPYMDTSNALSDVRNPDYGVSGNTSDFKGIVNTKIITDMATGQEDWRTAPTITNSYDAGYYPAACCCARFKTPGTKAFVECSTEELKNGTGFWYLPAAGELGYIPPRWADINDTISKLNSAYGIGVQLYSSFYYWSSSEYSPSLANTLRIVDNSGGVSAYSKSYNTSEHAFLRL